MNRWCWQRRSNENGFTLIELVITVAIVGILAATSVPTYSIFLNKARLLSAEISLTNALKSFTFEKEYSPASGMLADLVVDGYLDTIPNDPWTDATGGPDTGAEEATDWYYENDGTQLYLYAKSHPGKLYILASYGLPPLSPVSTTPPVSTTTPSLPTSVAAAKKQAKLLETAAKAAAKGQSKSSAKQTKADAKKQGDQLISDTRAALKK